VEVNIEDIPITGDIDTGSDLKILKDVFYSIVPNLILIYGILRITATLYTKLISLD